MALRRLVQAAFVLFLASMAGISLRGFLSPPRAKTERLISRAELARHSEEKDCWMDIAGEVYDVTSCIADHPAPPEELTRWCGREATIAFMTKGQDRSHGPMARAQLSRLKIGKLAGGRP